jgi:hypothetical protein
VSAAGHPETKEFLRANSNLCSNKHARTRAAWGARADLTGSEWRNSLGMVRSGTSPVHPLL